VKLSGTPQQIRHHPPLLGEHTEQVLTELGFDRERFEKLRSEGAFSP
jgi:formyl-CoA transferase